MADTVVQCSGLFPDGTALSAYTPAALPYRNAGLAPASDVSAVDTATVADGAATFDGLTSGKPYLIYGNVTSPTVSVTTLGDATHSEVDVVTLGRISQPLTGGTFRLGVNVDGGGVQNTAALPYDASAADVQLALEALSNVAPGDVTVTGSRGGPYTLTFGGALENTALVVTVNGASLQGGSEHRWTRINAT